MAVDFLVRLARFQGKSLLLFTFIIVSCKQTDLQVDVANKIDAASVHSNLVEGLLHIQGVPFSGEIFGLQNNKKDTAFISHYTNGKEDGEWKTFYLGGALKEQRFFSHGKKAGEMKAWWENGQLQMLYRFEQDEYEGTCREWNPAGVLVRELNYHHGHEEGSQRQWYDNGSVRSNYIIKNGRRYGLLGTKNCVNVADSIAFDK
jgi:hypothetical protein